MCSAKCIYNSTLFKVELIESRGFKAETHNIITSDGYKLTMFRIVNPNFNKTQRQQMVPVLLQHGLACESSFFLIGSLNGTLQSDNSFVEDNGNIITNCDPNSNQTTGMSLAFVLATCGYDVWLGNNRANGASRGHVSLSEFGMFL